MKSRIYTLLTLLVMLLPAITLRGEVITGTSEPFVFGDSPSVPLSPLAMVLAVILILGFVYLRSLLGKKQAA